MVKSTQGMLKRQVIINENPSQTLIESNACSAPMLEVHQGKLTENPKIMILCSTLFHKFEGLIGGFKVVLTSPNCGDQQ